MNVTRFLVICFLWSGNQIIFWLFKSPKERTFKDSKKRKKMNQILMVMEGYTWESTHARMMHELTFFRSHVLRKLSNKLKRYLNGGLFGVQVKELTRSIKVKVDEKMIRSGECLWIDGANREECAGHLRERGLVDGVFEMKADWCVQQRYHAPECVEMSWVVESGHPNWDI